MMAPVRAWSLRHRAGRRSSAAATAPAAPSAATPADDVELLTFIRQARTLGLHLDDVREVLDMRRGGTAPCEAVRNLLDTRITEIDSTVDDLLALRLTLTDTRKAADDRRCGEPPTVYSIIEDT